MVELLDIEMFGAFISLLWSRQGLTPAGNNYCDLPCEHALGS